MGARPEFAWQRGARLTQFDGMGPAAAAARAHCAAACMLCVCACCSGRHTIATTAHDRREQDITTNRRVQRVLAEIRARAGAARGAGGAVLVRPEDWPAYRVHIVSVNSFPTAAGLASSAAGYACLSEASRGAASLRHLVCLLACLYVCLCVQAPPCVCV